MWVLFIFFCALPVYPSYIYYIPVPGQSYIYNFLKLLFMFGLFFFVLFWWTQHRLFLLVIAIGKWTNDRYCWDRDIELAKMNTTTTSPAAGTTWERERKSWEKKVESVWEKLKIDRVEIYICTAVSSSSSFSILHYCI